MNQGYKIKQEPVMSDRTLLVSVEDLINTAFGSHKSNRVNFKLLQAVCHILAHQMRLLKQDVEIKIDEIVMYETYAEEEEEAPPKTKINERRGRNDQAEKEKKEDNKDQVKQRAEKEHGVENEQRDKNKRDGKREIGEKGERTSRREEGKKEDDKISLKDQESKGRSKDRNEEDKTSRDRDGSSRGKRGAENEGGQERERGKKLGKELGADGRSKRGGERRADRRSEQGDRYSERGSEREDRDARGRDLGGLGSVVGRRTSGTSITVSEATRRSLKGRSSVEKILIAERTPSSGVRPATVGSIEVVTKSQFALLEKAVMQLEHITGPQLAPVLPDNETLRQDLAKGRASLQETMQAVQLSERMQAAEQGLHHMTELLTQLAQSGMLPQEFADRVGRVEEYLQAAAIANLGDFTGDFGGFGGFSGPGSHSTGPVRAGGRREKPGARRHGGRYSNDTGPGSIEATESSEPPRNTTRFPVPGPADAEVQSKTGVTHSEMHEVLQQTKDGLTKEINNILARAIHSTEVASNTLKNVADKLARAIQIDDRIQTLYQQIADNAVQLNGLGSGINTLVQSFQQDLQTMKNDLSGGLALLEASNNNAETAALLELSERYQCLVDELDNTFHLHKNLFVTQQQISDELKSLIQCVEMLRETKTNHEEVHEGLMEKADISCLAGLLHLNDFNIACNDMDRHLVRCYEKFGKLDRKSQIAVKDLTDTCNNKAQIIMLMALKEATNVKLNASLKMLNRLEFMLGDPKAAVLIRKMAKDASCGACLRRAILELQDAAHGKPKRLPALRPPPAHEQPAEVINLPPDNREHTCHRWVGGSHTMMAGNIVKAGHIQQQIHPSNKYGGYGIDGRVYMMEDNVQPCVECKKLSPDEPVRKTPHPSSPTGAGDHASAL